MSSRPKFRVLIPSRLRDICKINKKMQLLFRKMKTQKCVGNGMDFRTSSLLFQDNIIMHQLDI